MGYWSGSGVDSYELETTIYCPTCDEEHYEVPCTAEGNKGWGTCPICSTEVEFDID